MVAELLRQPVAVVRERVHFDAAAWKVFKLLATQLGIVVKSKPADQDKKEGKEAKDAKDSGVAPMAVDSKAADANAKPTAASLSQELASMLEMLHGELMRAVGHVVKQPAPSTGKPGTALTPYAYSNSDPFGSSSQAQGAAAASGLGGSSPADFTVSFWVFFQIHHQTKQVCERCFLVLTSHLFIPCSLQNVVSRSAQSIASEEMPHYNRYRLYSPSVCTNEANPGTLKVIVHTSANYEFVTTNSTIPLRC